VTDRDVIRGISKKFKENKKSKKRKKSKQIKKIKITIFYFFENSFFFKITEITCADGIFVPTAHHDRRPKAMPTAKPVPTALWPVPTPAYADGDVPTVAVDTDCANSLGPVVRTRVQCLATYVVGDMSMRRLMHAHVAVEF
jgi:hypothetical protein